MQLWIPVARPNPYTSLQSGTLAGCGSTAFAGNSGFLIIYQIDSSKAFARHRIRTTDFPLGSWGSWPLDHRGSSPKVISRKARAIVAVKNILFKEEEILVFPICFPFSKRCNLFGSRSGEKRSWNALVSFLLYKGRQSRSYIILLLGKSRGCIM